MRGKGPRGLTLADMLELSDRDLERSHDLVQWLFPLNEPSRHVDNAPLITADDIPTLRTPFAKAHLLSAVLRFMHFYGMDYLTQKQLFFVTPAHNAEERQKVWATPDNHNLKRITRIIRSCRFFGAEQVASGIHRGFSALQSKMPHVVTPLVKGFWDDALNVPLDDVINVSPNIRRTRQS